MKKVLFITACGTATDILVKRLLADADEAGVQLCVEVAYDNSEGIARWRDDEFDILLLSPLLRYLINDRGEKEIPRKKPVLVVSSVIYGSLDGKALFELIRQNLIL